MIRLIKSSFALLFILAAIAGCSAQEKKTVESVYAPHDIALNTNPASPFWKKSRSVYAKVDKNGRAVPEYRTEIRTRWTRNNIYFLFICPYKNLYLKPAPDQCTKPTSCGIGTLPKYSSVLISKTSSAIRNSKCRRIMNGWTSTSISTNRITKTAGSGIRF